MINKKFKIGDKVKFTQKAKDRFEDGEYWHYANWPRLDLNKVYTIVNYRNSGTWPNYSLLEEQTAPCIAAYLLELTETQKNMQKKDFILALVQALFPDSNYELEYYARNNHSVVMVPNYPGPCGEAENIALTVRCSKKKNNFYELVLTVPSSCTTGRRWEDSDVEKVTKFLEEQCGLDCGENNIWIKNKNSLVMYFGDYPWHLVDEIKPLEQSPTKEDSEQIQALQAEIQQLKAENEQLKARTYTIEIPQGVTSICLNLKG